MTLTHQERDLIKAAFHIGFKAANQLHGRETTSMADGIVDLLIPIYQGTATLDATGAEIRLRNPEFTGDVEAILQENAPLGRIIVAAILGKQ